jgi:hypothetical protein
MSPIKLILPALLFFIQPEIGIALQGQQEVAILSKSFPSEGLERLDIQTAGLSLSYTAWEEDHIVIEVFGMKDNKPIGPQDKQLQKKLSTYTFDIQRKDQTLFLQVVQQKQSRLQANRDNILLFFRVQGPAEVNALVKSETGSITLAGIQGKQELQSNGGSIRAINCKGEVLASSAGGSFFVDNFEGKMELGAANGSVRIENFSGDLKAKSLQGSMSLFDMRGKVQAETEGGSIRANFILPQESIFLKSNGGSIDAVLPKDLPMTVNFSGSIVSSQPSNFQGESKKTRIIGTINGGGIPVNFETSGANVRVDYR